MPTELCDNCGEEIMPCPYAVHGEDQKYLDYVHSTGVRVGKHYCSADPANNDLAEPGDPT